MVKNCHRGWGGDEGEGGGVYTLVTGNIVSRGDSTNYAGNEFAV